jgi:hypothetical protein
MQEILSSFLSVFTDHRNKKSSWGRWAGSIIIATILFNWTFVSIKKGDWVPFDLYSAAILIGIYITLSIKSVFETSKTINNNEAVNKINSTDLNQNKIDQIKAIINYED